MFQDRLFLGGFLFLFPIYLLPLFLTRFLPGGDLPFHLAMVHLIQSASDPASAYHTIYQAKMGFFPYTGYYWLLLTLGAAMPLSVAHKLLMGAYVASLPLVGAYLLRLRGSQVTPALFLFPLGYNMTVHYGFISFALSIPLLLLFLARLEAFLSSPFAGNSSAAVNGWAGAALIGIALALFHPQNYLLALCCGFCLCVLSPVAWRARWIALSTLLPSFSVPAYWRWTAEPSRLLNLGDFTLVKIGQLVWSARVDAISKGFLLDLWSRWVTIPDHLLRGYTDRSDVVAGHLWFILLLGWILYAALSVWRKQQRDRAKDQRFIPIDGFLICVGVLLAYFALPHHLTVLRVASIAPRFVVMLGVFLLLLFPRNWPSLPRIVHLLMVALLATWGIIVCFQYRAYGRETEDFAAVLEQTPPNGKAVGLVFERGSKVITIESALVGLPSYYPVERTAPGSLVAIEFCDLPQMPCRTQNPAREPPAPPSRRPAQLPVEKAVGYFDYFFVRSGPPKEKLFGVYAAQLEVLSQVGTWTVYRKRSS